MSFEDAWASLHPAFRRSLELAHESLVAGGLPVGSTLTDAADRIVAEGRNRAYDPPGGPDALQGTPLAHAEMNTLAAARTEWELADHTLWSTQEPCAMCAQAAAFTGVGQVRYLAPDPWAAVAEPEPTAATARSTGPAERAWVVSANLLFLLGVAGKLGLAHPTVAGNLAREPAITGIVVDLLAHHLTPDPRTEPLETALAGLWDRITNG